MLVSPKELHDKLRAGALVFDARFRLNDPAAGKKLYSEGHIPGALHWDLEQDLSGAKTGKNGRHPLPSRAQLKELFGKSGIHEGVEVILYDDTDHSGAARAWMLLRWLGFSAVSILNGGWSAWCGEGFPQEVGERKWPKPENFTEKPSLVSLRQAAELSDLLVVDARAPERFRGEVEPLDPKAGHIPSAFNCFYQNFLDAQKKFRAQEELELLLPIANSVYSCGSGVTGCVLLFVAHLLGREGELYPGSWSEWCAQPDAPVEVGEYRFGVMAVIEHPQEAGKYLLLERADQQGSWQFPQGGWEPGEGLEQAVVREVQEEVGILCRVIQRGTKISTYQWPRPWVRENRLGQKHFWFLCRAAGEPRAPYGDGSFVTHRWVNLGEALSGVVDFKKNAYAEGLLGLGLLTKNR
jgi:thiosulfate/3-mercaptopyruvate sulfurtransferase